MRFTSVCIAPSEPAFVVALGVGVVGAVLLARLLVRSEPRFRRSGSAFLYRSIAWLGAEMVALAGPIGLTFGLFWLDHPGQVVCTANVGRWFFLPPVVLVTVGILWGVCSAALQSHSLRRT
jgi:hypothetical protein